MNKQNVVDVDVDANNFANVITFVRQSWKLITVFGVLGLVISGIYGLSKPALYEATLQIKMAQHASYGTISYIEQPAELIERLKVPTVYTDEVLRECGVKDGDADGPNINGRFKATGVKGVGDAIEIKLRSNKPEGAKSCANALLKNISAQQQAMIDDLLKGKQAQLERMQKTFADEKNQLDRIKQGEKGGIAYPTSLSALTSLRAGIDRLNDEFIFAKTHPTKLMTPIYVSSRPVARKIPLIILLGIFAGIVLGVIFAALRNQFRKVSGHQ